MKHKHKLAHMIAAHAYAECSTAERAKVGCVIVKDDRIISIGYNGMPSGWTNECEYKDYPSFEVNEYTDLEQIIHEYPLLDENQKPYRLKTKPEVLHAESNAVAKLARSLESGDGAVAFVTMAPCIDCAKLLYQAGIKKVYYSETYRSTQGLDFLTQCNIPIEKIEL